METVERWLVRCELVLVYAAMIATTAMMLLTSADAIFRYAFNSPVLGAYEITEKYLMTASIFLGLSYAYRGGVFIRVTFLVDRLPARWKAITDHVAYLLSLLCCLLFVFATGRQAIGALSDDTTMTTLPILIGPAYLLVPIGFLAMTVMLLGDLPRVKQGNALLFAQDAPTG